MILDDWHSVLDAISYWPKSTHIHILVGTGQPVCLYALNLLECKHTLLFISVMAEYALPSMNPTHLLQQGFTFLVLNTSF